MANRKVMYYCVELKNISKGEKVSSEQMKVELNKIFNDKCISHEGLKHLILKDKNDAFERITMDIISNEEDYLFGRVGKLKGNGDILLRNIDTNKANEIVEKNKRPEIYTYFMLDYAHGILGYLNNQSLPKPDMLKRIFDLNNSCFEMNIKNVINPQTVRELMTPGSKLSKIEYSYKVPSIYVLQSLGLSRETVADLENTDYQTVTIQIASESRQKLTEKSETIKKLIKHFSTNKNLENKVFKGKAPNDAMRNYKFDVDNYSLIIDVPRDKIEGGKTKIYTLDEITEEVKIRMKEKYINNRKHILRLCGIE